MTNPYFDMASAIEQHSPARSPLVNALFEAIEQGFDLLPAPAILAGSAAFGTTSGTATVYTLDPVPAVAGPLAVGMRVRAKMHATSAANPRLNLSGLGAVQIRDYLGGALAAGALIAGSVVTFDYDGAVWRVQGLAATTTIAGFGIGAVGAQTPYLADFHATGLATGVYRWDGNTLNAPESPGGGSALLSYRGDGQAHWIAFRSSGNSGDNNPVNWEKTTSAGANDWGVWRRDSERGFVSGKGNYFRLRGGLQICQHILSFPRVDVGSLGINWEFPVAFDGAPWYAGAILPAGDDDTYVNCLPTDVGNIACRRAPLSGTAGISAPFFLRKATAGNFASDAVINNVAVWALGRWY